MWPSGFIVPRCLGVVSASELWILQRLTAAGAGRRRRAGGAGGGGAGGAGGGGGAWDLNLSHSGNPDGEPGLIGFLFYTYSEALTPLPLREHRSRHSGGRPLIIY
ncbi:unnamed protein product [Pleuronectes platessa]|uniref:Uncharacterized protein n=1 Tax=Pleuronectes platessa TaxID=8262 RepID=A0A9N7TYJ5_PLEPL|nr:unnamed protein product [Pleuronectes platessa]